MGSERIFSARGLTVPGFHAEQGGMYEFSLSVRLSRKTDLDLFLSADQYYRFFLDGKEVGRTAERGTFQRWFMDKIPLSLSSGKHELKALVWHCGRNCTAALVESHELAFFLESSTEKALFNTGLAPWKCRKLPGVSFHRHLIIPNGWTGVHAETTVDHQLRPGPWETPVPVAFDYHLCDPMLPFPQDRIVDDFLEPLVCQSSLDGAVREELPLEPAQKILKGESWKIPAHTVCRAIFRLADYDCGWPLLSVKDGNGCKVSISLAESLFLAEDSMEKGRIDEFSGKYFRGVTDRFVLDGEPHQLQPPVWRSGNYLQIGIQTEDIPVRLNSLQWKSTPSALPMDGQIHTSDEDWESLIKIAERSLQMNSHDRFTDCPYYEQLSYTGDGRLELLSSYTVSHSDVLARKMILQFADTANVSDVILCRTPASAADILPSFSLWFAGMLHDYARWKNDPEFVRQCLPALCKNNHYFLQRTEKDGLFRFRKNEIKPTGRYWDFIDWVPEWTRGEVTGDSLNAEDGMNTVINWLLVYSLELSAELESGFGADEEAERDRRAAQRTFSALQPYLDPSAGLYNLRGIAGEYAEHPQILSVLSGLEPAQMLRARMIRMNEQQDIAHGAILFIHYLWEAAKKTGTMQRFFMPHWKDFLGVIERGGKTFPETFYHSRSECHGWGAVILFTLTSVLGGIAPDGWGFRKAKIEPELELLPDEFHILCPHPAGGCIKENVIRTKTGWDIEISLPDGVEGLFRWKDQERKLRGYQNFEIKANQLKEKQA